MAMISNVATILQARKGVEITCPSLRDPSLHV